MSIEEKIRNIINKLQVLLSQLKKISVKNVSSIPIQINKIVNGINKMPLLLDDILYEISDDDLKCVTKLSMSMFNGLYKLQRVTIPESVLGIESSNLYYCPGLKDIYIKSIIPPSLKGSTSVLIETTIHVPIGSGDAYKSATNWSVLADRIVEDIQL
jgi:hypothetical protein